MNETNKFKAKDIVRFIGDGKDYLVVRAYKTFDNLYKYDVQDLQGKTLIIAMPETTMELKGNNEKTSEEDTSQTEEKETIPEGDE